MPRHLPEWMRGARAARRSRLADNRGSVPNQTGKTHRMLWNGVDSTTPPVSGAWSASGHTYLLFQLYFGSFEAGPEERIPADILSVGEARQRFQ